MNKQMTKRNLFSQLAYNKSEPAVLLCQHCGAAYVLGVRGTVMGCDSCEGVLRNPLDGTIIECVFNEFEDSMTDMEKA